MSLKERVYSVLVVSSSQKLNTALSALLEKPRFSPVVFASDLSTAKRAIADRAFDFLLVNSPLPEDSGIRLAVDTASSGETAVLLLVPGEFAEDIHDKTAEYGVFTLGKPTAKPMLLTALSWMESMRERMRKAEKKATSIEEKMQEIRLVNRAKWLLIAEEGMDEETAHHDIERQAMDRCITKRQIAEEIIRRYQT